ncbi:ParB/RepB/Spo0J family partition protein [Novosphingobium panipatense]|jgi:ParB family chromosome partitioning protein|uniref:Chromosome partitioning protein, ParB family n=1 Tax=Novosphingobium panipatense TaxID=428991 RepID=A0ABY1QFF1_9SPHN|nr:MULTISPECIES: ParB/RepB/Spo0J family partition protein [Novosphingobium]SMP67550.1 chromosome partitioning protein, ParB family [Novosphingobium panipatense]
MTDDSIVRFSVPQLKAAGQKSKGLGRGLGALLGETRREEPLAAPGDGKVAVSPSRSGGLAVLSIADVKPDPNQPRRYFEESALEELAASIAQRGVIQPIIVRPLDNGRYQLVAGERRWRAAQKAQLHEIPALVRDLSDREVMALALIENLQREDLNPIEEARAYNRLAELEGMTQAEIARMVDKSRSHVANFQRLLALPDGVIGLVEKGDLSMGHARALIGCDEAEDIAQAAVSRSMSVRDVEKLVRKKQRGDAAPRRSARTARSASQDADIVAVQNHLEEFLGLPVKISADADPSTGTVTIRYATLDQLDLICQRLTGGAI